MRMLHSDRADQLLLCDSYGRTQACGKNKNGKIFSTRQQEEFPMMKTLG